MRTPRRGTTRGPPPPVEEIRVLLVALVTLLEQPLLRLLLGVAVPAEMPRRRRPPGCVPLTQVPQQLHPQ